MCYDTLWVSFAHSHKFWILAKKMGGYLEASGKFPPSFRSSSGFRNFFRDSSGLGPANSITTPKKRFQEASAKLSSTLQDFSEIFPEFFRDIPCFFRGCSAVLSWGPKSYIRLCPRFLSRKLCTMSNTILPTKNYFEPKMNANCKPSESKWIFRSWVQVPGGATIFVRTFKKILLNVKLADLIFQNIFPWSFTILYFQIFMVL